MSKFHANMFNVLKAGDGDDSDNEKPVVDIKKNPKKAELGAVKEKRDTARNVKDIKKPSGVSAEPHPLDRRSGTGRGKENSKNGAGKYNYGTYKDDLAPVNAKDLDREEKKPEEKKAGEDPAKPAEEPEVVTVQLSAYYESTGTKKTEASDRQKLAADEKALEKFQGKNEKVFIKKPIEDQHKKSKKEQWAPTGHSELDDLVQRAVGAEVKREERRDQEDSRNRGQEGRQRGDRPGKYNDGQRGGQKGGRGLDLENNDAFPTLKLD